jgi:hypothetical protein
MNWPKFPEWPPFLRGEQPRVTVGLVELVLKFDGATDADTATTSVNGKPQCVVCRIRSTDAAALLAELKRAAAELELAAQKGSSRS